MKFKLQKFFLIIIDFLFPSFCSLCNVKLINSNEIKYGLCDECKKGIIPPEGEKDCAGKCAVCGKPLISETDTCLSCRNNTAKSYDKLWVIYPYSGKYRELLAQYKFKKKLPLSNLFIDIIMPILEYPELKDAFIVPVPPRPGKEKEQGWDQINYLVNKINRKGKPVLKCLKRRKSQIQKELNRQERIQNLKDRIYSSKKAPKKALIIDDVYTTGATMEICSGVLKEAGAEIVYGLCLFYD